LRFIEAFFISLGSSWNFTSRAADVHPSDNGEMLRGAVREIAF
jgi:hypothetical protein